MESLRQFIPYSLSAGICALIVEIILSARWSIRYFTTGIPIYWRTIKVQPCTAPPPTAAQVETALPESGRSAPMLVRGIGRNRFAFREKFLHFGIGYSQVMRGCITCKPATGELEVRGYLNWYVIFFSICLLLFLLVIPTESADIIIPLCLLVLLSYIYRMQKKRFRQVEDVLQRFWSEGDSVRLGNNIP